MTELTLQIRDFLSQADGWSPYWPCAAGVSLGSAVLRQECADFQVTETLPFTPSGAGQHAFLFIEKTNLNTTDVAQWLAKHFSVPLNSIGFCGLKDKRAVTQQWFSLDIGEARSLDVESGLLAPGIELLVATRHQKKLRRGVHVGNGFKIVLRDWPEAVGREAVALRMDLLLARGVPNYFGPQRFGKAGSNLRLALELAQATVGSESLSRPKRVRRQALSMAMSAARSWCFNQALARQLSDKVDYLELPCGLPDGGELAGSEVSDQHPWEPLLLAWLGQQRLQSQRRAAYVLPEHLTWAYDNESQALSLSFALRRGSFATAVLREICTAIPATAC